MTTKVEKLYLFTNRACMAFDRDGQQVIWAQLAIDQYGIHRPLARRAVSQATEFRLSQWRGFDKIISRLEMEYMLGLRTKEMDMAEAAVE